MLKLQYLIIYQNSGLPIYSRCFADLCKISMKDDILLSGFLSALSQAVGYTDFEGEELSFEEEPIMVNTEGGSLKSVEFSDMKLLFYYLDLGTVTIAAGFPMKDYVDDENREVIELFFSSLQSFMEAYDLEGLVYYDSEKYKGFEEEIVAKVIDPWMKKHGIKNKCPLGDHCPYRMGIYENEKGSIFERLQKTVRRYSKLNMFKKMKMMFTSPSI